MEELLIQMKSRVKSGEQQSPSLMKSLLMKTMIRRRRVHMQKVLQVKKYTLKGGKMQEILKGGE